MADGKISVLVADDHAVVRAGLRALIGAEPDMEVIAEAADGRAAIDTFAQVHPDVVLLDLRMPGLGGRDVIAAIRQTAPAAKIIVLTSFDGDEDVYRAVQAGARGYLLKSCPPEDLIQAVRTVHGGGLLLSGEAAARLAERMKTPALTSREVAVLELVAKGLSNKEVGGALSLAEDTVKNHLKHIYAKLEVGDRTEAVLVAMQRGILVF